MEKEKIIESSKTEAWFDDIISNLRKDELLLKTNTAGEDKSAIYDAMIFGEPINLMELSQNLSSQFFIKRIVSEFFIELNKQDANYLKIALSHTNSKVLVWAVINDEDEASEDKILLAEAKTNSKYHTFGFHVTTTIIEESDKIPVPVHYQTIK